jgi:hypothetical protein
MGDLGDGSMVERCDDEPSRGMLDMTSIKLGKTRIGDLEGQERAWTSMGLD